MPKHINEINFTSIENTKISLLKSYSRKTAHNRLSFVFNFLNYLKNKEVIPLNFDLSKIGTISAPTKEPDPFTIGEYNTLISSCRNLNSASLEYSKLIFILACYTGLRTGELSALCRNDVDMNNLTIKIKRNFSPASNQFCTPKTKNGVRTIFLQPPAVKAMNALLEVPAPNPLTVDVYQQGVVIRNETIVPLLKNERNGMLKPKMIYRRLKNLIENAGIRYRRPYQTRHTFACWNLTAHGNISFIANQMGHRGFLELQRTYGKFMDQYSSDEAQFIWRQMLSLGHEID